MAFNRVAATLFCALVLAGGGSNLAAAAAGDEPLPDKIRFNRDVRPILSDTCFKCHGFDEKERKAGLRLDTKEGLTQQRKDITPIVPGDTSKSEVFRRVFTHDEDDVMPPVKSGKKLTARQKEIIKRWIEEGMDWEPHWSFTPVKRADVPKVSDATWVRNPIDAFVLERLEREGLKPTAEADKVTLIRRLTLDLTGLPPTPAEVDAFVADASADAYEKLVDRLLASPRYGERMAVDWLDAGRYADTHGYHIDSGRDQTKWREWVIDAFTKNKPYNQFIIEQFAGDLLPNPTIEQRIATGFHRNNMINFEGGANPDEYHTAYVKDRVSTVGTVFLGLTVACAECHDHKYDPITAKDYYSLYAFFNNVPEKGLDGIAGNAEPVLRTPTTDQQKNLDELAAAIKATEAKLKEPRRQLATELAQWEAAMAEGPAKWTTLDPSEAKSVEGAVLTEQEGHSILASGPHPVKDIYHVAVAAPSDLKRITAIRIEALPHDSLPGRGPGRFDNGNLVMSEVKLALGSAPEPLKFKAASADYSQPNYPVADAIDGKPKTGWAIYPQAAKAHEAVFEIEKPIDPASAGGMLTVTLEFLSAWGKHQIGHFRLSATDSELPHGSAGVPEHIKIALATPAEKRSELQKNELRDYYRDHVSPETRSISDELAKLKKQHAELEAKVPSTMVMAEMPKPRDTHLLVRGAFDDKGEKVTPAVPAFLPPMPTGAPANRLGLAQWLVDESHPLTARVAVNRYWQMFFGNGIVKTTEDFGSQGELPSHPELLDWLASDFRESGWDVRRLVKSMVTSSVYRQLTSVSPALVGSDPENRLLARGPRFRLQAEFIRDQALAVAGLLDGRIGGPSVSPYQPAGLWEELMSREDGARFSAQTYVQSKGPDLYRRTMYTFWKRTVPPPSLYTFDAPDRETCTVKRARTNTPLQALVLMNDPTYVEASRKLAERVLREGGASIDERIAFAFRLPLARQPKPQEVAVLKRILDEQLAHFRSPAGVAAAAKLLAVGESPRDEKLDQSELAAWTTVASVILNLDETVTKG